MGQVTDSRMRWDRRIELGVVNGHPCRMYAQRPRAVAELLLDAQRWAERPFIVQGARRLTGKQHAQAVAGVAHALRERGVSTGDRVVIIGYNSIEWLVAFWAVQCLGATAVLGNAWWSDEQTVEAIALAAPAAIISDRALSHVVSAGTRTISFATLTELIERQDDIPLQVATIDEDAPALIIFSSGTTGQAKGVVMSHRCVIANIQNLLLLTGRLPSELSHSHPGTVSLLTMPLFHLAGIQVSLMTMLSGGKLVFLEGKFDPVQVLRLIGQEKVRAWGSVPTMVSRVIQHEAFADYDTSSVSSVQMGGAAVPAELREQVQKAFPKTKKRVGSMYGFTEVGGVLAAASGSDLEGRAGCVGKPLPCVEVAIRDANAEGVGEIVARTPTATAGYLGDATPISDAEGWISSGDLGRLDAEGFLYVVGRSKDIIIRGGENVASVRVEQCLRTYADVVEVAVVPLPNPDLGEEVGAAVVLRRGAQVTIEELLAHARQHLAKFEVPSQWWLGHEALPTNASGKVIKGEVIARWPAQKAEQATGAAQ